MREECLREFGFEDVYRCRVMPRVHKQCYRMQCNNTKGVTTSVTYDWEWPQYRRLSRGVPYCWWTRIMLGMFRGCDVFLSPVRPLASPCRPDKERENAAALEVLPDLLRELDAVRTRLMLLISIVGMKSSAVQGLLANVNTW